MSTSDPLEPASQTRIQSVSRAVHVLKAIAKHPEGASARTLSTELGLSLPTTYNLLTTLWGDGMLVKTGDRTFQLGPEIAVLGEALERSGGIPRTYREALDDVVARTGESAYLSAWSGIAVRVIAAVEGRHAVRVVGLAAGYGEHLHARASGKLLLAFASDDQRARAMDGVELTALTPQTITTRAALDAELDTIRADQLAFDREEFQLGVHCVSAPIFVRDRVDACITVSTPTQRFVDTRGDLVAALQDVTASLTTT